MNSLPKPEIIITHESDLDGFVSGLLLQRLAKKLFDAEVPLKAFNYTYWGQYPLREASGWISDLSFEKRVDLANWLIVDHHQFQDPPRNVKFVHDASKSASLLAYELCKENGIQNEKLDRLVELTNIGDLFLEDDPSFDEAQDYGSLIKVYGFWNMHSLIGNDLEKLIGHPLLEVVKTKRNIEDPIGFEWSKQSLSEITPEIGYVQIIIGNQNLIVNQLLKDAEIRYPVLLTMGRTGNGPVNVSLRSRNGEALPYAQKLYGGGHPNACGACLPKTIHHSPDAIDYLRKTLNPVQQPQESSTVEGLFDAIEEK